VQSVPIWQYGIVYPEVLEDLDHGKRSAWKHALLRIGVVKEADVLVHIENVLVREALDIFVDGHNLLQVLILTVPEDGIVDDYAVHGRVVVRVDEGVLEKFAVDFAELKGEATVAD
jgi:hypothetical protein